MIRALIATLADMAGVSASLAAARVTEEVEDHKQRLALGIAGIAFACAALLMATLLVAVIFWDTHRVAALACLTLFHAGCAAAAFLHLRARARSAALEKEILLMRSTLGRLRLELAAQRIRRSPAAALISRIASFARPGRALFGFGRTAPSVRYRTDQVGRAAYAAVSPKEQAK